MTSAYVRLLLRGFYPILGQETLFLNSYQCENMSVGVAQIVHLILEKLPNYLRKKGAKFVHTTLPIH